MLASAIALTLTAIPFVAKAQTTDAPEQQVPSQTQGQHRHHAFDRLNLTQAQKDQLEQIKQQIRTQIENILTQDQKTALEAAKSNHQGGQQAFAALNLSQDQKEQMRSIMQSAKSQMDAVLTPEQKQQLQQDIQQWHQQHNQSNQESQ